MMHGGGDAGWAMVTLLAILALVALGVVETRRHVVSPSGRSS
jgi:hypothetical protein